MRKRKVGIMFLMVAVSALTLFLLVLFDGQAMAQTAAPDTLENYRQTVIMESGGDARVEILAVLGEGKAGPLLLPLAFEGAKNLEIIGGPVAFGSENFGPLKPLIHDRGHLMLNLTRLEHGQAGETLLVSALVPGFYQANQAREEFGEYGLKVGFVNTSALVMNDFLLRIVLPDGMLVHEVKQSIPEYFPKKSPTPPYSVARNFDRGEAYLIQKNLAPSDRVLLDLRIRPVQRSMIPLIAGVILAVLYLIFFRDVLRPSKPVAKGE